MGLGAGLGMGGGMPMGGRVRSRSFSGVHLGAGFGGSHFMGGAPPRMMPMGSPSQRPVVYNVRSYSLRKIRFASVADHFPSADLQRPASPASSSHARKLASPQHLWLLPSRTAPRPLSPPPLERLPLRPQLSPHGWTRPIRRPERRRLRHAAPISRDRPSRPRRRNDGRSSLWWRNDVGAFRLCALASLAVPRWKLSSTQRAWIAVQLADAEAAARRDGVRSDGSASARGWESQDQ